MEYLLWRHELADGEVTTVYVVRYPRRTTRARVVYFARPEHLDVWCRRNGVDEAIVGGFFVREPYRPLGELWIGGRPLRHEPVAAPYAARRGSVVIDDGDVRLAERAEAPARPPGDPGSSTRISRTGATRAPRSASPPNRSSPLPATDGARTSTEACRWWSWRRSWSSSAPSAQSISTAAARRRSSASRKVVTALAFEPQGA